jgi:hypothetical protein
MESIGLSGNQRIHACFPEENSGGCGREAMRVLSEIGLRKGLSVEVYEDRKGRRASRPFQDRIYPPPVIEDGEGRRSFRERRKRGDVIRLRFPWPVKCDEGRGDGMPLVGGPALRMVSGRISEMAAIGSCIKFGGQVFWKIRLVPGWEGCRFEVEGLTDLTLKKVVASLSEGMVDEAAIFIVEVIGWPIMVVETVP